MNLKQKFGTFNVFATSTILQKCLAETARMHTENKESKLIESLAHSQPGASNSFYDKLGVAANNINFVEDAVLDEVFWTKMSTNLSV